MLTLRQRDYSRELETLGIYLEQVRRIIEIAQHCAVEPRIAGDAGEYVHSLLAGAAALQSQHLTTLNALAAELKGPIREAA